MAYEKLNLKNGDTLTEAHLQHLEEGIANAGKGSDLLDENGILKKEYFPEGFPYGSLQKVTVMPETVLTRDPDSQLYIIPNVLELTQGRQYTVKLSMSVEGETYEYYFPTVCREAPENEGGIKWLLGNLALLNLGEDTGEAFVIGLIAPEMAEAAGFGGMMMVSLALDTITVSITCIPEDFSFIDPGYLPAGCETIIVETSGEFGAEDFTATHTAKQIQLLLNKGKNVVIDYRKDDIVYRYTLARRYDSGEQVFCCVNLKGANISVRNLFTSPDFRNWNHTVVKAETTYDTTE